jgi:hypothetical protein
MARRSDIRGGLTADDVQSLADAFPAICRDALALKATPTPPAIATSAPTVDAGCVDTALRCDPEFARIAIALKMGLCLRLWIVLRQLRRESNKHGFTWDELCAALDRYHVRYSKQNLKRWLNTGNNPELRWWHIDQRTGKVYPVGYARLAVDIVEYTRARIQGKHATKFYNIIATNRPGSRDMYIDVSSYRIRQFEANVYAAWIAYKENPPISRFTLTRLWNATTKTLIAWGHIGHIRTLPSYAYYSEAHYADLPTDTDGKNRPDVKPAEINGRNFWEVQVSNVYISPIVKQHDRRGKSRRASREIRLALSKEHVGNCAQSLNRDDMLKPTGSLFYESHDDAKESVTRRDKHPCLIWQGSDGTHNYFAYSKDGNGRLGLVTCARLFDAIRIEAHSACTF